jgi:pilus assembly protein CpaF
VFSLLNSLIDDEVTDLFISGRNGVWVRRRRGIEQASVSITENDVRNLAVALIDAGGRHIDDANPCVDVRLGDGVRVHAVLSPVSVGGTEISIRVPARIPLDLNELVASSELGAVQRRFLETAVASGLTFLVTGSTGSGKTTLLAALMSCVPVDERIITIEDVAELRITHPRVVALEARQPNTEGLGGVGVVELIRQSLRMRPDRLVVGECRGADVVDMLRAFTTGHGGGGSTLHANALEEVPIRILSLAALSGLGSAAISLLARAAIDVVVHIDTRAEGRTLHFGRFVNESDGLRVEEFSELS